MEWFQPLIKELKHLFVPFCLAATVAVYGLAAPNPPFLIAGAWALVATVAIAVFRSLDQEKK